MSQADFDAALQDPTVQQTLEKWKAAYDVAKIQGFRLTSLTVNT
jgi:thiol:disulfide interchange protein DsbA